MRDNELVKYFAKFDESGPYVLHRVRLGDADTINIRTGEWFQNLDAQKYVMTHSSSDVDQLSRKDEQAAESTIRERHRVLYGNLSSGFDGPSVGQ